MKCRERKNTGQMNYFRRGMGISHMRKGGIHPLVWPLKRFSVHYFYDLPPSVIYNAALIFLKYVFRMYSYTLLSLPIAYVTKSKLFAYHVRIQSNEFPSVPSSPLLRILMLRLCVCECVRLCNLFHIFLSIKRCPLCNLFLYSLNIPVKSFWDSVIPCS